MRPFYAASPRDLLDELHANDVRVPLRTQGRTTSHCETWISCRFLAAISQTHLLDYPLGVIPGDRPDLILALPSGRTGIEITEAVSQDKARVDAFSESEGIADFRSVPHYRAGENLRSKQEIEDIARGRVPTYPRMGDSIERDWVEAMVFFTRRKADKFTRPGFEKHDRNWLLVYDNWSPVASLDDHAAADAFDQQLCNADWPNPFATVFILRTRDIVWEFSRSAAPVEHQVPDL